MNKIAPLPLALVLLACSTGAPDTSSPSSAPAVGSSAEALLKLGRLDADDVQKCRAAAERCAAREDAGASPFCDRIERHCDELDAQLAADRAELEQCLEAAAACEQSASDPAECASERAACAPADGEFRARRGRTMECATRAERCIGSRGGFGPFGASRRGVLEPDAGAVDAGGDVGALACEDGDVDFVGCCRGRHGRDGDAGVNGFGARGPGAFGRPDGMRPDRDRDRDGEDAGAPRRGGRFGRSP